MCRIPPTVEIELNESVQEYWLRRAAQHTRDVYAGVGISKFPEDLRVYEHLLWRSRPEVVIELGTHEGGSALWFRDRLRTLEAYGHVKTPLVVSIDLDTSRAAERIAEADPEFGATIHLVSGDVRDPLLPERVRSLIEPRRRCLVVEDTAHVFETTYAALEGFSSFVHVGGYFVVEDGCVDVEEMRLDPSWPSGVLPALVAWLATTRGSHFVVRRDLELYGLTCHPSGFLERRA